MKADRWPALFRSFTQNYAADELSAEVVNLVRIFVRKESFA